MVRLVWVWFVLFLAFPVARAAAPRVPGPVRPALLENAVGAMAPISAPPARTPAKGATIPRGPLAEALPSLRALDGAPLAASDFGGRAVLVEFWAADCINCRRTAPAMRALGAKLEGSGVLLLGIHTPERERERDPANVRREVARQGLHYPVAIDNSYGAWRAFGNQAWPALYLVGRDGSVRWRHVGELHEGTPAWDELLARLAELEREPS